LKERILRKALINLIETSNYVGNEGGAVLIYIPILYIYIKIKIKEGRTGQILNRERG